MREFPASETTTIRQMATVLPILDAVELNIVEQFPDSALDAFAVEFMLSFPTCARDCTHVVKKAQIKTVPYFVHPAICCLVLLAIVSPPAKL